MLVNSFQGKFVCFRAILVSINYNMLKNGKQEMDYVSIRLLRSQFDFTHPKSVAQICDRWNVGRLDLLKPERPGKKDNL